MHFFTVKRIHLTVQLPRSILHMVIIDKDMAVRAPNPSCYVLDQVQYLLTILPQVALFCFICPLPSLPTLVQLNIK